MEWHIILDMDGTLIDGAGLFLIRPHLYPFLLFCFANFDSVNIWTAASDEWFNHVYSSVFLPAFKWIEKQTGDPCAFGFIYTRSMCEYGPYGVYKKLSSLHESFSSQNTIIVDDSPETYYYNVDNAIPISRYCGEPDLELLKLCFYLQDLLDKAVVSESVLGIDKSQWMNNRKYIHKAQFSSVMQDRLIELKDVNNEHS